VIRRATLEDVDELLRIHRESATAAFAHVFPPDRYPFPDDQMAATWRRVLEDPEIEVFIAEGVGSCSVGHGYLRTLYVVPSHWSQGIGSQLHDLALERLRAAGETEARLWTLEANHVARGFHERRGWTLTRETRTVEFPPHPLDVQYVRSL
jgi:GNAT superfamily N-acetyltransferase